MVYCKVSLRDHQIRKNGLKMNNPKGVCVCVCSNRLSIRLIKGETKICSMLLQLEDNSWLFARRVCCQMPIVNRILDNLCIIKVAFNKSSRIVLSSENRFFQGRMHGYSWVPQHLWLAKLNQRIDNPQTYGHHSYDSAGKKWLTTDPHAYSHDSITLVIWLETRFLATGLHFTKISASWGPMMAICDLPSWLWTNTVND